MLDSLVITEWQRKVLDDIQNSGVAELCLVVLNDSKSGQPSQLALKARIQSKVWNKYCEWDYSRNRSAGDAFAKVDVTQFLQGVRTLRVRPIQTKFVDRFQESDLEQIRAANLDVLLRFGFRIIKGPILDTAQFGVWSFHHGDSVEYRGGPPLFWEIYEKNPVSGTILQALSEQLDGGRVLYKSFSRTDFSSLYVNRNATYWKTSEFVLRKLRDVAHHGWDKTLADSEGIQDPRYDKAIYREPSLARMGVFLLRRGLRAIRNRLRGLLFTETDHQWFVAFRRSGEKGKWSYLMPTRDRFYADPFCLERDGKHYLFFEDFRYRTGKGLISMVEIRPDGSTTEPLVVMNEDVHLSYPFVFVSGSEVYMIPETRQRREVALYRAKSFPHEWELERVLLKDVAAVDATFLEHGGRAWIFCNIAAENASGDDELHIFFADSLMEEFKPHRQNPVVSDVRRARPAGKFFVSKGELIRPAQDCSVCYGYSIVLNRVDELTPDNYRETSIGKVQPDWSPHNLGTHTINSDGIWETRDGKRAFYQLRPWLSRSSHGRHRSDFPEPNRDKTR
jgi:hypothetical protein